MAGSSAERRGLGLRLSRRLLNRRSSLTTIKKLTSDSALRPGEPAVLADDDRLSSSPADHAAGYARLKDVIAAHFALRRPAVGWRMEWQRARIISQDGRAARHGAHDFFDLGSTTRSKPLSTFPKPCTTRGRSSRA
jgi:hypothetical protein